MIFNQRRGGIWSEFKTAASTEDIQAFKDFCEFREMCANAAKKVMESYN